MKFRRVIRRTLRDLPRRLTLDLFPIRRAVAGYGPGTLQADARAGLNVALLAFPQGMAYALIAGLPIEYGIYGGAVAAMIGPLFAGSRFIMLGPTNATAVLLFMTLFAMEQSVRLAMMPLLLLLTGGFLIIGALLGVANLIQYVSRTVVTGYITAAALYIIVNQTRKVLGVQFEIPEGTSFLGVVWMTVENSVHLHLPTVFVSILTATIYLFIRRRMSHLPNVAVTLVAVSLLTIPINHFFGDHTEWGKILGGGTQMLHAIDASQWMVTLPSLNYAWINELALPALLIAFLSVLEGTSIGKSLAARAGERLDTNQEMFGMGIANVACGFLGGMPASGSLTRSQLSADSGARTALASVLCGLFCAIGAYTLGPLTGYIPTAALAVLVIFIGISLIKAREIRIVYKTTNSDAVVFVTTFLAALLIRLDVAIILGTATSILLFLRKAATPELIEYSFNEEGQLAQLEKPKRDNPQISIVHVEGNLFFGAADLFRDQMRRMVEDPSLRVVVLKMRNAHHLDATSIMALEELITQMNMQDRYLLVSEARKDVIRVFRNSGLIEVINRKNIFPDVRQNPTMSTARALRRAQELLGDETADVQIWVNPSQPAST